MTTTAPTTGMDSTPTPTYPASCTVDFYVYINEQSTGWTNHGTALYYVFTGFGLGAADAIAEAARSQRDDYAQWAEFSDEFLDEPPPVENFIAIRRDHQHNIEHQAVLPAED